MRAARGARIQPASGRLCPDSKQETRQAPAYNYGQTCRPGAKAGSGSVYGGTRPPLTCKGSSQTLEEGSEAETRAHLPVPRGGLTSIGVLGTAPRPGDTTREILQVCSGSGRRQGVRGGDREHDSCPPPPQCHLFLQTHLSWSHHLPLWPQSCPACLQMPGRTCSCPFRGRQQAPLCHHTARGPRA